MHWVDDTQLCIGVRYEKKTLDHLRSPCPKWHGDYGYIKRLSGHLAGLAVGEDQHGVIVKHLLKVRHQEVAVGGVAAEDRGWSVLSDDCSFYHLSASDCRSPDYR